MIQGGTDEVSARSIRDAFAVFDWKFREITRRSRARFEARDWHGVHHDARQRLEVYREAVDSVVTEVRSLLGQMAHDKSTWVRVKECYGRLVEGRGDLELARTFFNSVTRRIFSTVGVDAATEYVDEGFQEVPRCQAPRPLVTWLPLPPATCGAGHPGTAVVLALLGQHPFRCGFRALGADAVRGGACIDEHLAALGEARIEAVEVMTPLFYRNKGAYLVGRLHVSEGRRVPLLLALTHPDEQGVTLDAVLLDEDEVSIVFSFTRSYFHVDAECPHDAVAFLHALMPRKPLAELYTSLGYNKHGKTVFYQDLLRHMDRSDDRFEIAPGERGMVMIVFTLPSYDVVFKIIKDRFTYPKNSTRREVMDRYDFVFMHDRAGRLVDAQEFEHLEFARERFSDALLEELLQVAGQTVRVSGDRVDIRHVYVERRLTPLNLYLARERGPHVDDVVLDHGQTIKDLVGANIFPGDILLKNFGVTRHGRVVFYDYDELCLLTDCNFREIPEADDEDDSLGAEPWFHVAENDIFPQEFCKYLGISGPAWDLWKQVHGDLLTVTYWKDVQARLRAGAVADIFPYRRHRRLQGDAASFS